KTAKSESNAKTLTFEYDGKTTKYSGATYKINIDNKEVKTDFPGIVFNKATMLPVRAVFEQMGGKVIWNSKTMIMDVTYNGMALQFKNNDANAKVNGKTIKLSAPVKKINDRLIVPIDFFKQIKEVSIVIDDKAKSISIGSIASVREVLSETSNGKDIVTIKINNFKGFKAFRLTNPNKIVVDFENVKTSEEVQTIKSDLSLVKGISISPKDTNSTRIVLELEGLENFSVETLKDGCKIIIQKPINAEMSYINNFDRVYFSLKGINLASVNSTITNHFKEEYDIKNNKYTIILPASSALSLANETININDALVNNVEIIRDKDTSDTHIVFHTKKELKFYTSYNEKLNQTEINLLIPAKDDEQLVVIDAGHGGLDPGAADNSVKEKDINLAIALKLEKLLKAKNVKTFSLRQDDTFVGLYDRPYIANALNATLFLSIHNNAIDNKNVSGTETLYYHEKAGDKSLTGEKFAKMIQDLLLNNLKSVNRKTVDRPGLVVLKYTKMPSALAEIGFVTNPKEAKNLQSEAYQQKAAEALCEAIVKALEKIKLEKKTYTNIEIEKQVNTETELNNEVNTDTELDNEVNTDTELDKEADTDIEHREVSADIDQ
ncbi:MAG: N-acetylmuramoyl-L-alanine amidase, partial [Ruminiclostridium sp.]